MTPIEELAVRLVDLLELRHAENGEGDYHAIGVYELCLAIKMLACIVVPDEPCRDCNGLGYTARSVLHPTNPNYDSWARDFCTTCRGTGVR